MKFVLVLSLVLLCATTVLAQDTTSVFVKCIENTDVTPGSIVSCFIVAEVGGVDSTDPSLFVITTNSPADSGSFLNTTLNPDPHGTGNTSLFQFDYTIGSRDTRTLIVTVQVNNSNIVGSPYTVPFAIGLPVSGLSLQVKQGNVAVSTVKIFTTVQVTVAVSQGRSTLTYVTYGDGGFNTTAIGATPVTVSHLYTTAGGLFLNANATDGVSSTSLAQSVSLLVQPCDNGNAPNAQNNACQACQNLCSHPETQLCQALANQAPACNCAPVSAVGSDCSIPNSSILINQQINSGNNQFGTTLTGSSGNVGTTFGVQSSKKRAAGNTFYVGTYTIPNGESLGSNIAQTGIAFTAELVDSVNHGVAFSPYILFTFDITSLALPTGVTSSTLVLLQRVAPSSWLDSVAGGNCPASVCIGAGVPGCKALSDVQAKFVFCNIGGPFALVSNITLLSATGQVSTGGSLPPTVPPTTGTNPNQQFPNIPSPAEPSPVAPPPVVLPPNAPVSQPPPPSAGSTLQPFIMVALVVMSILCFVM